MHLFLHKTSQNEKKNIWHFFLISAILIFQSGLICHWFVNGSRYYAFMGRRHLYWTESPQNTAISGLAGSCCVPKMPKSLKKSKMAKYPILANFRALLSSKNHFLIKNCEKGWFFVHNVENVSHDAIYCKNLNPL